MFNVTFNQDDAMGADNAGGLREGGVYVGEINEATVSTYDDTTRITYVIKTESKLDLSTGFFEPSTATGYIRSLVSGSNGDTVGKKKLSALLGLLGFTGTQVEEIQEDGRNKTVISNLKGVKVAFATYNKEYWGEDSDGNSVVKPSYQLLHFFDPQTFQTFSEKARGVKPEAFRRNITDSLVDKSKPPVKKEKSGNKRTGFNTNNSFQQQPHQSGFNNKPPQQSPLGGMEQAMGHGNVGETAIANGGFPQQPQQAFPSDPTFTFPNQQQ